MPGIEFRGKTYNHETEMPPDIRKAYHEEKTRAGTQPLSDLVDMSPEVRAIYERALGDVDQKLTASRRKQALPETEDIYRQSAPADMQHLPSDESIYQPSRPLIDSARSAIEPESSIGVNRLVASLLWALLLAALAFLVMQLLF